jgi:GNAT superfamily N-acetyltransferase
MPIQIRPAVATDLPRMMGMDHSVTSDYVWQLDLRRETGQVSATLREVRLPRPVPVAYPRNPFALADEWQYKDAVLVAVDASVIGYICIVEQSAATVAWVTDLVIVPDQRRHGIGSLLLKSAQDWALEHGSHMFSLRPRIGPPSAWRRRPVWNSAVIMIIIMPIRTWPCFLDAH